MQLGVLYCWKAFQMYLRINWTSTQVIGLDFDSGDYTVEETIDKLNPVFPDVVSIIVLPFFNNPCLSPSSII